MPVPKVDSELLHLEHELRKELFATWQKEGYELGVCL